MLSEESLCRVEVLNRRTSIVAAQCHLGEALVVEARLHEAPLALALLEAAAEVLLCLVDEGESKRQRASCLIGAPVFAGSRLHPRRYVEGWRQGGLQLSGGVVRQCGRCLHGDKLRARPGRFIR